LIDAPIAAAPEAAAGPAPRAAPPPSALDRAIGAAALLLWRAVGLAPLLLALLTDRGRARVLRCPAPPPGRAWLHGASRGEQAISRAIAPLFEEGCWPTQTSARSPTPGALPAPPDLPFTFVAWLRRARPTRLVLIEAELWPGWLAACRQEGVPVLLIGARDGRGWARWRRSGPLGRAWLDGVRRLSAAEIGDLKALDPDPPSPAPWAPPGALLGLSLRGGDSARLLDGWQALGPARPPLVLCPRHAADAADADRALRERGLDFGRRSRGEPAAGAPPILLLDTLGEQAGAAQSAAAALLGGSFDPAIGGHAPTDAIRAGVPVVVGPHSAGNAAALQPGLDRDGRSLVIFVDGSPQGTAAALAAALARGPSAPAAPDPAPLRRLAARLPAPCRGPERPPRPALRPLRPLWRALMAVDRAAARPAPSPLPIVVVGGLAAGGSGKTPITQALLARLPGAAVVGRGYGRGGAAGLRVGLPGAAPAAFLGDELELLRRRGAWAFSAPDKTAGLRAAAAAGARLALVDDGLQSWTLRPTLRLAVVDAQRPTAGGLLPAGGAREGWGALDRAQIIVLYAGASVRPTAEAPRPPLPAGPRVWRARARPEAWLHRGKRLPLDARTGPAPVACGLAHNGDFIALLIDLGLRPTLVAALPDHGPLPALPPGCVITEKDAARAPADADLWALCLAVEIDDENGLIEAIEQAVSGAPPASGGRR
jgi:tetraacyldisaccharide 4'-kinase